MDAVSHFQQNKSGMVMKFEVKQVLPFPQYGSFLHIYQILSHVDMERRLKTICIFFSSFLSQNSYMPLSGYVCNGISD